MRRRGRRTRRGGRGVVAVEMAILFPFLMLACLGVADIWLLFHRASIVQECAANGAAAGVAGGASDIQGAVDETARTNDDKAAWVDRLIPAPTVATSSGKDGNGFSYVEVTVTYTPDGSIFAYHPTGTTPITRTVRMMIPPPQDQ